MTETRVIPLRRASTGHSRVGEANGSEIADDLRVQKVAAALDTMSQDDVRQLVIEIEQEVGMHE